MGIITSVVLGLTLVGMAFGALFGFLRGRERALLRLVLVVISAFLALALRGAIVDTVMNINIDGATLNETLMSEFSSGDASLPDGLKNLIFALFEIVIGFVAYFILLFALRFLSWLLVFPFLKLIIRVFEKKRKEQITLANASDIEEISDEVAPEDNAQADESNDENAELISVNETENAEDAVAEDAPTDDVAAKDVSAIANVTSKALEFLQKIVVNHKKPAKKFSKHRGQGALVGLVQGVLVAYFLFAPLTCLLTQINRITSLEMNGKPLVEMPEEIGITEYTESGIGKFYNATGGWYYRIMTTTTDANGNKVSLDSTLKSVAVILEVANVATSLEDDLKIFDKEDATPEEIISSLNSLSDKLISVGTSLNEIDEGTKNMIKDLVVEMGGADASQEDIDEMMDNLTPELFTQAGNAMKTYAEYEQVKLDGSTLTQDQANDMVEKAYGSLKLIGDMQLDVNDADKGTFKDAIDNNPNIPVADRADMYKVFGIEIDPNPAD